MEDLNRSTARRLEGEARFHSTQIAVLLGQWLDHGGLDGLPHLAEYQMVADLPAHNLDPVLPTRQDHDPPATLVHAQIQRFRLRAAPFCEAGRLEGEGTPGRHAGGPAPHVAQRTVFLSESDR
ncbi:hypothetical protein [Streptomyces sp. NPDC006195]|uniref:hypothetical protein n=1 Tax=unclassified Streptomyces TaxID=2593676 RepID=UPI0033A11812